MKKLIFSQDNSIEPNGAIGKQKCGIIFWQKTGFLRHCNELGFQSMITLVRRKYSPTSVQIGGNVCYIQFDNDDKKMIFLSLKKERNSKHCYIYGESNTVYADAEFHLFALEVVNYIAKNIGCKFYVDDATEYLKHGSKEKLEQYIEDFDLQPVVSDDLLRKSIIEHQNRPLDINEILSRENECNVVVDAYDFFMRQNKWEIDDSFNKTVQNFLYSVLYDGFIGNGGISVFLIDNGGLMANSVANALHNIGAVESERILRKSFDLFPNSVIPEDETERQKLLGMIENDLTSLDIEAYNADTYSFCYRYLMNNKEYFLI
ncbi:MAG: DUF4375 domain-containing protein [Clostridia bacterium]|nr:DUF4375 domain-containing protein [Clostridia bacterium]